LNGTDVTHQNDNGHDKAELMLWQALGLTEDPKINYDIVATAKAAIAEPGTIVLKGRYAI
jgi:hypothetical protein